MAVFITILGIIGLFVIFFILLFLFTIIAASPIGFICFKAVLFCKRCICGDNDEEDDYYVLHKLFKDNKLRPGKTYSSQLKDKHDVAFKDIWTGDEPVERFAGIQVIKKEHTSFDDLYKQYEDDDENLFYSEECRQREEAEMREEEEFYSQFGEEDLLLDDDNEN